MCTLGLKGQYRLPNVSKGCGSTRTGRYRHAHAAQDVWVPLLQENQRCSHVNGNFWSQQREDYETVYRDQ